jgi:hypothetical protein
MMEVLAEQIRDLTFGQFHGPSRLPATTEPIFVLALGFGRETAIRLHPADRLYDHSAKMGGVNASAACCTPISARVYQTSGNFLNQFRRFVDGILRFLAQNEDVVFDQAICFPHFVGWRSRDTAFMAVPSGVIIAQRLGARSFRITMRHTAAASAFII